MEVLRVDIRRAGYMPDQSVIRDIRFTVAPGELVGIIGPNGAGKSTTIKAIMGLLSYVDGSVELTGPQGNYAYIPEQPILYDRLTLWEHLELAAAAHELSAEAFHQTAENLIARYYLQHVIHHYPTSFSKGMQQKVMLIAGFMAQPDLYIIDEPFIGLDPHAMKDLLVMLQEERKRGAGVIMSTHMLDTAEKICDSFLLIHEGTVAAAGSLSDLRERSEQPDGSLLDCYTRLCVRS
jgi:ABC-2 type transport system ATP-binding protein